MTVKCFILAWIITIPMHNGRVNLVFNWHNVCSYQMWLLPFDFQHQRHPLLLRCLGSISASMTILHNILYQRSSVIWFCQIWNGIWLLYCRLKLTFQFNCQLSGFWQVFDWECSHLQSLDSYRHLVKNLLSNKLTSLSIICIWIFLML